MTSEIELTFKCDGCSLCCRSVGHIEELKSVNGICINLNRETNQCLIYDSRPLVCQVIKGYQHYGVGYSSIEDWIAANEAACQTLKEREIK